VRQRETPTMQFNSNHFQ